MSSIRQFFTLNLLILAMAATAQSGALDPGFSGDGIATLDGGTNTFDLAYAGALQPDGKILVAGWTNTTAKPSFLSPGTSRMAHWIILSATMEL